MKRMKSLLLMLMVLFQISAIIYFFINIVTAIYLIAFNILSFILLMVIVIMERIKEKREEDDDDYRNY
jgi:fatty acid desaturase